MHTLTDWEVKRSGAGVVVTGKNHLGEPVKFNTASVRNGRAVDKDGTAYRLAA